MKTSRENTTENANIEEIVIDRETIKDSIIKTFQNAPAEVTPIYDPTQEIVDRLDRIAKALEDRNGLSREELRAKGIIP